jgi:adenosylcobinamide kinase/adenosylcobinamide-phosphate guanylyltransferase
VLTLILGGARSGKSRLALEHAARHDAAFDRAVCFIATADARDAEMAARIARHQAERPPHWQSVEAGIDLACAIRDADAPCVVVDCLTLWLTRCLCDAPDAWPRERAALLAEFARPDARELILVANETGLGIVPLGELTRRFVDEAGWLNQDLARLADRVVFSVAGLPHYLKGQP